MWDFGDAPHHWWLKSLESSSNWGKSYKVSIKHVQERVTHDSVFHAKERAKNLLL
jgi:hypothetical protein